MRSIQSDSSDEDIVPYADDPLADSAWTAEYEKEMKENEELEKELKHRLEGRVEVDVWYVSVFFVCDKLIDHSRIRNKLAGFPYL